METLGFQNESQKSKRDFLLHLCEYRRVQPFAVHPAAKNDTSLNTGSQQKMNFSKWWTDFAMQQKKTQRDRCGGNVLVLSALKQTQQRQKPTISNSSLTVYTERFFFTELFRPQLFCPLKAACADVEERLLLHEETSPPQTCIFTHRLPFLCFYIFVGSAHPIRSDLDLCWRKSLSTGTTWANSLELCATQSV